MDGEKIEYPDDASSPAASLLESERLFNSTKSDARIGARFMSCNLKDFLLETLMPRAEYTRIHLKCFPPDIGHQYEIEGLLAADVYV